MTDKNSGYTRRRKETCFTIMINDQFIALSLKEAIRVYDRLGDLLKDELFDSNKEDNRNDNN